MWTQRKGNPVPAEQLSAALLESLPVPETGVLELRDAVARGLSLRVFTTGRKVWTFRYRPKDGGARRRIGLGEYPSVKLAEARRRADRYRGEVSGGRDPQGALSARRAAPTLGELIERYLGEEVATKKKPRTVELYTYYLQGLVASRLGSKKAHEVTPGAVDALHRSLGAKTPVTANRAIVALSGVYTFAARRRLIAEGINPARGVEKFREQSRERYLSTAELVRLGEVLRLAETEGEGLAWPQPAGRMPSKHGRKAENRRTQVSPHVTAAIRLLLLTGCRLREILGLRWGEVDLERGLLLLPDSKTGRKAVVLNAPALQVLAGIPKFRGCEFVILGDDPKKPRPDLHKPWWLIKHHAGLEDVRLHDLRHTHASIGAGAGLGLPIIGKLLGHKHADTTARYAHLDDDPLRRASDRIGSEIAAALEGRPPETPGNVVGLGRR
jgi:integrase